MKKLTAALLTYEDRREFHPHHPRISRSCNRIYLISNDVGGELEVPLIANPLKAD